MVRGARRAALLGYVVPRKAVWGHYNGRSETELPSAGGPQRVTIIPERDVYRPVMRHAREGA